MEGRRDPGMYFHTTLYLIHNSDVAAAGVDPLEHCLQYGRAEGRQAYLAVGQSIVNGFGDVRHRHHPFAVPRRRRSAFRYSSFSSGLEIVRRTGPRSNFLSVRETGITCCQKEAVSRAGGGFSAAPGKR
jgi:hypothetical protein